MAEPQDPADGTPLNERLLDLLVYVPVGLAVSVVGDLPLYAARGRERVGVQVSSARAVGQLVAQAGQSEWRRRSERLWHRRDRPDAGDEELADEVAEEVALIEEVELADEVALIEELADAVALVEEEELEEELAEEMALIEEEVDGGPVVAQVPPVATLSIPGFDTLSASQVVQRLDGLAQGELVSVRAYEAAHRGRRTILNRVDQLLDERS